MEHAEGSSSSCANPFQGDYELTYLLVLAPVGSKPPSPRNGRKLSFWAGYLRPALAVLAFFALFSLTACSPAAKKARVRARADHYFDQGDYDKAKIEYLNLLRIDRQSAAAYARLGAIWQEEGAPLRAAPYLLKSRELTPDDLENRVRLGRLFVAVGRKSDATQEALTVLEKSPANGDALRVLADAADTPDQVDRLDQELRKFPKQDEPSFQLATAVAQLRKGNRQAAEEAVRHALAVNPQSSPAHFFMAAYWFGQKDSTKAGTEFRAAAEFAPARSPERLKYAEFMAQSGALDQAVEFLQSMTRKTPDYLPAWNVLAEIALKKKNYDEALRLLINVLNRDAENFDGNLLQARVWLAKGDAEKATAVLERLDEKFPDFAPLKYELAQVYLKRNNSIQAIDVLNQTIVKNPDFVQAILLLGQLNLRTGKSQLAIDAMEKLLRKHPGMMEIKIVLADAYRAVGRLDDAARMFREQIQLSPQNAQAFTALGIILHQQQKDDEARQAFEKALEIAPDNSIAAAQLIDLEISARNFDNALQRAQQMAKTTSNAALSQFLEGKIYAAQAKWDAAEGVLTKALTSQPNLPGGYSLLASVYLARNKLADAAHQLESLVAQSPNDTRALMTLGIVYEKMRAYPQARGIYEKLVELAPGFTPALNNLAYLDVEYFHENERAYQLAHKAHDLQPADASIADTLGWVLYHKRDYKEALQFLKESAARNPNEPQIQYHLGMAQYMVGDTDAARVAFKLASQSSVDFPNKGDAQRRLALLAEGSSSPQLSVEELKQILGQQPDDLVAWTRLGEVYEKQKAFAEAAASYEEVIKLNPKITPALSKLAELYSGPLKNGGKGLEYAKTVRELLPSDPKTAALLGRIAYQAGNANWAYSLLKESSRDLSDDPRVLHDLAWVALSLGKLAEAKTAMEGVVTRAPDSAEASDAKSFLAMVSLYQNPTNADSSSAEVARALKEDGEYVPAQLAAAALERQKGNAKTAAQYYERVLARFPDFAPAEKDLAGLYVREPLNPTRAYELALRARKALPDDAELADVLVELCYQRKDYSRALQLLQESARNRALDPEHLYYLGMCSFYTRQNLQAREALDQALAAGLKDPLASDAKRALENLSRN
jgi:tetratricopeptide (TPR) repeat protein